MVLIIVRTGGDAELSALLGEHELLEVRIVCTVADEVGLVEEAVDKHWVARENEDIEDKGGEDVGEVLRKALVKQQEVKQQEVLCLHEAGMMAMHVVNLIFSPHVILAFTYQMPFYAADLWILVIFSPLMVVQYN